MKSVLATLLLALSTSFAVAHNGPHLEIEGAWARASVPGQKATGAFMKITAPAAMTLVGASTPAAAVAEIHEMKMEGDVMRMRALSAGLPLPAGKAVELKPGGYHVMLMDLKAPLVAGSTVPLTLSFKGADGKTRERTLQVPVATTAPAAASGQPAASMNHGEHKH